MTPEQRLDRAERILIRLAKSGREARSEFREKINILIDAQIRNEALSRSEFHAINEQIHAINAQIYAINEQIHGVNEQMKGLAVAQTELTRSQKLTDKALRAFINSLRKGENGKSSN